ncbi:IS1595 family transposase [Candidatus Poriferisocius sp.]|uniref:IS1595 family transposase n=1 Tax=Candidatus Poriferisocius sp. TaxID=3101276 RepID=UPI003B0152A7
MLIINCHACRYDMSMEYLTSEKSKSHRAPGRAERSGITVMDAVQMFDTEDKAEAWFVAQRWPGGMYCPHCGSKSVADVKNRKPQPWRRGDCRKHFSVKTWTMMDSSNIPLSKWAMCVYLYSTNLNGVSSMKLHRDLGIGQKAAWYMANRIRQARDQREEPFVGPVEGDETFVGGEEANKHESKKLRAGRGSVGKTAVVGVKDRETGRVHAEVVEHADAPTLTGIVSDSAEEGATVFTDEWKGYRPLGKMGFDHGKVQHSVGQWVDGQAHTNGIESFWSMLKRGYHGTYHQMSREHLNRYVAEFRGRHNQRPLDALAQMSEMVRGGDGKQTTYGELIAGGVRANKMRGVAA